MKLTVKLTALSLLIGALALSGCGGGGSSAGSSSSRAAVLITDSFREDFGHVWATIYHVELVPQGGGAAVVLFDDPTGRLIDLKTLRDASGARYSFLGSATIPDGTYTGVNITIGSTMQLFKNGVASGDPIPVDSSVPVDSNGHPLISVTFKSPKTVSSAATTNICIDFDLAHFVLKGSKVVPALVEGDGTGLHDPSRHEQDEYRGTISGLTGTAPTLTFTLNRGNGMTVTVNTTASTALFGAALAEGSAVEVTGTLDPATQVLVATQLEVKGVGLPGHEAEGTRAPHVAGAATNINATAGTFTIATTLVRGFTPSQTTVKVVTTSSTVYRADAGATQTATAFFTALAATPNATVEGTYDATSNTLTATSVKVVDTSKLGGWEHDTHPFRGHGSDDWGNESLHGGGGHG